ncbi:hypothetical protein ACVWYV_001890 [Pantoea eucalypti]
MNDGEQKVKDYFFNLHLLIYCIHYFFLSGEE